MESSAHFDDGLSRAGVVVALVASVLVRLRVHPPCEYHHTELGEAPAVGNLLQLGGADRTALGLISGDTVTR